ncbi:MAG TPA: universal stress protein [Kofleriaceae bacterium]|nr:universal stress protein [Kofleriaceae bacterium]
MSSEQSQVIVAYDFSASARSAMSRGVALAARAPFHVLHFICVLDPHHGTDVDRVRDELAATVDQELRAAELKHPLHFHVHVRISRNPAKEILALASEIGADLIVVGCKGRTGIERLVLGSVSEHIVREAGCAVVIARPKEYPYVVHEDVVAVEAHPHHRSFRFTYDGRVGVAEPLRWPGA